MESPYADLLVDYDSQDYWDGCARNELLIMRCTECGFWIHYPRTICPKCWSAAVRPAQVSGLATLFSFVLYHEPGGIYPLTLAELVEQKRLRIPSTVVNCELDDLTLGMPLQLTWISYKGLSVPAFEPRV
jgi:uncharacterized OB-fold protein